MLSQALRKHFVKEAELEKAVKNRKVYLGSSKFLHARKNGRSVNWTISKDESGKDVIASGSEFI